MKRKWYIVTAFIVLAGLAGCSSEPRSVTMHEPGVYKGDERSAAGHASNSRN